MTGRRLLGGLAVVALLALAACAGNTGGAGTTGGAGNTGGAGTGVAVTLVRSGGFTGVHDEVVIDGDGAWRLTDGAGKRRTGRLTDQQRDSLRTLAADPRLAGEAARSPMPTRCADTYSYALTVNTMRISFVDCPADADPPQAARAIVNAVTQAVWT